MQYGFALLEAGCVRAQSATNSMWKNCISAFTAAIGFWLVGYALAFGESRASFVGSTFWAFDKLDDINNWFFQFSFCATASTIVSGAMAERAHIAAYTVLSFLMSSFFYPIAAHWAWGVGGWLGTGLDGVGYSDFAGSGVIHIAGGAASLAAVIIVRPRKGRWQKDVDQLQFMGHSTTVNSQLFFLKISILNLSLFFSIYFKLASLGCMILATGFVAFNAGSNLHIDQPGDGWVIGKAAANTMIAGAGGMLCVGVIVFM